MFRFAQKTWDRSSRAASADSDSVAIVAMGRRVTGDLVDVACLAAVAIACWLSFKRILDWYFIDVDTFPLIATGRIRSCAQLVRILTQPLMQGLMPNARFFRPLASISQRGPSEPGADAHSTAGSRNKPYVNKQLERSRQVREAFTTGGSGQVRETGVRDRHGFACPKIGRAHV